MIRRATAHDFPGCPSLAPTLGRKDARRRKPAIIAAFCVASLVVAGCHSYHIDTTIENHTGDAIQLLEVDYPSASFGADSLAAGAVFHYRFQVRGSGPLTVSYTTSAGHPVHNTGPALFENEQGQLHIVLLPGAKADFEPMTPPNR
jgi:hypothetical protein